MAYGLELGLQTKQQFCLILLNIKIRFKDIIMANPLNGAINSRLVKTQQTFREDQAGNKPSFEIIENYFGSNNPHLDEPTNHDSDKNEEEFELISTSDYEGYNPQDEKKSTASSIVLSSMLKIPSQIQDKLKLKHLKTTVEQLTPDKLLYLVEGKQRQFLGQTAYVFDNGLPMEHLSALWNELYPTKLIINMREIPENIDRLNQRVERVFNGKYTISMNNDGNTMLLRLICTRPLYEITRAIINS